MVLGVLSLIIWALILVVTLKYVLILLRADNNGEGGTLALMALAAARARRRRGGGIVILLGIIGARAVLRRRHHHAGDLGAVGGRRPEGRRRPAFDAYVVPLTVVILIALFAVQSRGTAKVAAFFGPITLVWFVAIAAAGLWHIGDRPGGPARLQSAVTASSFLLAPRHHRRSSRSAPCSWP